MYNYIILCALGVIFDNIYLTCFVSGITYGPKDRRPPISQNGARPQLRTRSVMMLFVIC